MTNAMHSARSEPVVIGLGLVPRTILLTPLAVHLVSLGDWSGELILYIRVLATVFAACRSPIRPHIFETITVLNFE